MIARRLKGWYFKKEFFTMNLAGTRKNLELQNSLKNKEDSNVMEQITTLKTKSNDWRTK